MLGLHTVARRSASQARLPHSRRRIALTAALAALAAGSLARSLDAQGVSATDYARADRFLPWNARNLVAGDRVDPHWMDGDRFWFDNHRFDGHEFVLVDPARGSRRPAFDHARLAAGLSAAADTSYEPYKLPFRKFEFVQGGRAVQFALHDSIQWTCDLSSYACTGPDTVAPERIDEVKSPDGNWVAFSRDENLWVRRLDTGEETQLSQDGEENWGYAVNPEGCCYFITEQLQHRKHHPVLRWSPDSKRIVTYRLDERNVKELHLLQTKVGRPALHSYHYALPGDSVIPTYQLYVFDVPGGASVKVQTDPLVLRFSALQHDSIWGAVRWSPSGDEIFFTDEARDFKRVRLLAADASTGAVREVLVETSPTFVELNPSSSGIPDWRVLAGGREAIWWSERDGWGHLYRYDAKTGAVKNRITSGPWEVVDLLHVDEAGGWVYFTGVGRESDRDIYFRQLYRAQLDGSRIELLSPEPSDHDVNVAPDGRYIVDTYSRRDTTPVTVLRGPDGRRRMAVQRADIAPLLDAGWPWPRHFVVKARDGVTDLHGFLYFPSNFDSTKSYPVVDYIYPGPQVGPIGWRSFRYGPSGNTQALAELGFIVFTIDAMGTPLRSKAFHDAWYGDMEDNGILDHVVAIQQLARRYPQMDLGHVGIYGHSGGGFSSTDAILRFPNFFKVAVSSAGNHDNRSYFYSWGEKYQGQVVKKEGGGDNYDSQANEEKVGDLKGKLMLMYGTMDDNVHPNAALLVIDSLIAHNKDFDLIVMPNRNHRYSSDPYVIRRTWDYFVKNLMGAEPPKEYEIRRPSEP